MPRESAIAAVQTTAAQLTVGRWLADPEADTLTLDGQVVKLQPRTMRLLVALCEQAGAVCRSGDLLERVWPGVVVTDQSLYQAIGELRAALKADTSTSEFIANVPRKGYRFVAPVRHLGSRQPASASAPSAPAFTANAASTRTVGVLPFRDHGLPAALSFLPETLLGDLVLELSRQPGIHTIARGTMLSYRGLAISPRRAAEELKVHYLVDGSLTAVGNRLIVACDLIDTTTDAVLTSESIDTSTEAWAELAYRVVGRLVRVWRLQLTEHATRHVGADAPHDASAMELAMRAWVELYCRPQSRETNELAWRWAAQAVERDSTVGAAWNALAYCEYRGVQWDWLEDHTDTTLAQAVAHAERATRLSPSDPDAHYTLGLLLFSRCELVRAEASLRHCLVVSASYAPAYGLLGLLVSACGRPQEAFELCTRALQLSPREPLRAIWHWGEACAASMLGREEDALAHAARGIAANPDFPTCYLAAAVAARRLGRETESARFTSVLRSTVFRSIARVRERVPAMRVEPWASAFLADLRAAGLPER